MCNYQCSYCPLLYVGGLGGYELLGGGGVAAYSSTLGQHLTAYFTFLVLATFVCCSMRLHKSSRGGSGCRRGWGPSPSTNRAWV